jgi:tripartite-type tricarboxylate transporter receptor subunit TctC
MHRRHLLRTMAAGAVALAARSSAQADSVESFYHGKTVTLFVATSPGGNYDLNGRLVSRHLGRFIPGNPNVVVQNVPGAGGLLLANRLANTVEHDGLTIAIMERGTPQTVYEGDVNSRFDPLKLTWIGSLSSYANDSYLLLVNSTNPAHSVEDLKTMRTRLGGDAPGSTNLTFAILARDLLKLNIQVIRGYHGAAPMFLAMQSGELDGQIIGLGSVRGAQQALWNGKKVRPLLQFGRLTRHPDLPDVPTARELIKDPATLAMLEFAEIPFFMALPFVAPPDIPADRAQALQSAFMQMAKDPQFLEDAERSKFEISAIDGAAVRSLVQKMAATPKDVVKSYAEVVSSGREAK